MNNNSRRTVISISNENYIALHTIKSITGVTISEQLTQALFHIVKEEKMENVKFHLMKMKPFSHPRIRLLNIKKSTVQQLRMFHLEIDRDRVRAGLESVNIDDVMVIVLRFYHSYLTENIPAKMVSAMAPRTAAEHEAEQIVDRMRANHDDIVIERYKSAMGITSDAPQSFL